MAANNTRVLRHNPRMGHLRTPVFARPIPLFLPRAYAWPLGGHLLRVISSRPQRIATESQLASTRTHPPAACWPPLLLEHAAP